MAMASSLWSTFGKQLKDPRRLDDIQEISATICKNNETALPEHEDYQPWLESFTGMNLRWETVGSVFAALTTALLSLPERDAFFCSRSSPIIMLLPVCSFVHLRIIQVSLASNLAFRICSVSVFETLKIFKRFEFSWNFPDIPIAHFI